MAQSSDASPTRFLTVSEVATALRVSNMTVYRLISSGELPAVKVGKCFRLPADKVDQYLDGRLIKAG
ncbi:MAG: helix-turn-helix domain-containing protein [Acidimicrobiales bacterium]